MAVDNLDFDNNVDENNGGLAIKYLTFAIGENTMAIPISEVISIVGMQPITSVPEFPSYAKGIINLRGTIIPVVEVRARFGMEEQAYDDRTCIIIVSVGEQQIGLVVDQVNEVADIPYSKMSSPPNGFISNDINSYLIGIARQNERVLLIIDSKKLVFDEDKSAIFGQG